MGLAIAIVVFAAVSFGFGVRYHDWVVGKLAYVKSFFKPFPV